MKRITLTLLFGILAVAVFGQAFKQPGYLSSLNVAFPSGEAPPYSPSDEPTLHAWYKADAGVTNTSDASPPSNGEDVRSWTDQAGLDEFLDTPGDANYPSYVANAKNSLPAIEFNASEWLERAYAVAQPELTIFIVAKTPATISAYQNYYDATNVPGRATLYHQSNTNIALYAGTSELIGGKLLTDTWYVMTAYWSLTEDEYLRTNGVQAVKGNAGPHSMDGLFLGRNQAGTQDLLSQIGEIAILTNNMTNTSVILTNMENYLGTRWGITIH